MSHSSSATALALAGLALALATCAAAETSTANPDVRPATAPAVSAWPSELPLEMRVPSEPTAFPSAGRTYLTYELYLTNFAPDAMTLRRIEVLAADAAVTTPIAVFEGGQLNTLVHRIGNRLIGGQVPAADDGSASQIAAGGSVVVFLSIAPEGGVKVPARVRHRVATADATIEGAVIGTHHTELRVLGPPLTGMHWTASSGPSNDSHHRRGLLVLDGRPLISRRYAIDWIQIENGVTFSGDPLDNRSYYSYGEPVLAVGDGRIVTAQGGLPDNVPRFQGKFIPAIPLTMQTAGGNSIVIDMGGGQFAHYMHLQPGSLRVKAGDRVRRGQLLAKVGASGDAREAHLHFEVTTSPQLLLGEGVPYLIDRYRVRTMSGSVGEQHKHELPLKDTIVDFDGGGNYEGRH